MRRLFSTFANGAPGVGLLLIRLVYGADLVFHSITSLMRATGPHALLHAFPAVLGLFIIVGLWTPIAGALAAIWALASVVLGDPTTIWQCLLRASVGAELALLGPGALSIDARLFGWKRVEIRNPNRNDDHST